MSTDKLSQNSSSTQHCYSSEGDCNMDDLQSGELGLANNIKYDVIGFGQVMYDLAVPVTDDDLQTIGIKKGRRRVVDSEGYREVMDILENLCKKTTFCPAGSLNNTMVGLAALEAAKIRRDAKPVPQTSEYRSAMAGMVCPSFYHHYKHLQSLSSSLSVLQCNTPPPQPPSSSLTESEYNELCTVGKVVVLNSTDAQRSFVSYPGEVHQFSVDDKTLSAVSNAQLIIIEGYLLEFTTIYEALIDMLGKIAAQGVKFNLAITAGDANTVSKQRDRFTQLMKARLNGGILILFSNEVEASALAHQEQQVCCAQQESQKQDSQTACEVQNCQQNKVSKIKQLPPQQSAVALTQWADLAVVTAGGDGSVIAARNRSELSTSDRDDVTVTNIPAQPGKVIATTGAGDAYAAGFLFAFKHLFPKTRDWGQVGLVASSVASIMISQEETVLVDHKAESVIEQYF